VVARSEQEDQNVVKITKKTIRRSVKKVESALVEKVTPVEAQRLLDENNFEDNRKISQPWVVYLARQMEKGLWQLNGEPLIFDERGKLLNGQHRLSAVVLYGKPVEFLVVRGVKTKSFTTLDQNRVRSAGQVFGMQDEKHGFLLAALCRKVFCWENEGHLGGKRKISPDELHEVLEDHPELREAAEVGKIVNNEVPVDGSMVAFCYWLFAQSNKARAKRFFEGLETSVAAYKGDPVIVLRKRFFRERDKNRRRWGATELLAIFIRAWNYYAKNEPIKNLAIKPDKDGSYRIPTVFGLGTKQGGKGSKIPEPADA